MKKTLLLLGMTLLLNACVSPQKSVPPVSQTPDNEVFVWHDLASNSPATSEAFYKALFGWEFQKIDSAYSEILQGEVRVGGLIHAGKTNPGQQSAVWFSTVKVKNIYRSVERIKTHGGEILREPEFVAGRGTLAFFADPNGAILGIVEPLLHNGEIESTDWIWHELITNDAEAAATWFAEVFELKAEKSADGKRFILRKNDFQIASVSENPFEDTRNQWVPVLAVVNFDGILEKVEGLGGQIILPPSEEMNKGQLAMILDPNQAPIVIQKKGAAQ